MSVANPATSPLAQGRVAAGDPSVPVQSAAGTLSSGPYIPVKSAFQRTNDDEFENTQNATQ